MSLSGHTVDAIGRINGDIPFIGRQATYLAPSGLAARLRSLGHVVDPGATSTPGSKELFPSTGLRTRI
jgi:hypothetical protein